jgi:predicted RNA binding protein YcfA (HicA-like mRNA interferase family)
MRVPRDVHGEELVNLLKRYGYVVVRQRGSHIRMEKHSDEGAHAITVPDHKPIKIGTLQDIAKDVCNFNKLNINHFYGQLLS